ncbi:MAG: hypothetical protein HWD92_02635 [Flavobacteriia bacterium]|nr:hypothetical protein [Flavobacteriia bacterium]
MKHHIVLLFCASLLFSCAQQEKDSSVSEKVLDELRLIESALVIESMGEVPIEQRLEEIRKSLYGRDEISVIELERDVCGEYQVGDSIVHYISPRPLFYQPYDSLHLVKLSSGRTFKLGLDTRLQCFILRDIADSAGVQVYSGGFTTVGMNHNKAMAVRIEVLEE